MKSALLILVTMVIIALTFSSCEKEVTKGCYVYYDCQGYEVETICHQDDIDAALHLATSSAICSYKRK